MNHPEYAASLELANRIAPIGIITKLDPRRFPNMSPQMVAYLGFFLNKAYTDPQITEMKKSEPLLLIATTYDPMFNQYVDVGDFRRNFENLFQIARLTPNEESWCQNRLNQILE